MFCPFAGPHVICGPFFVLEETAIKCRVENRKYQQNEQTYVLEIPDALWYDFNRNENNIGIESKFMGFSQEFQIESRQQIIL